MKTHFKVTALSIFIAASLLPATALAKENHDEHNKSAAPVSDQVIQDQRDALAANTKGKGFGPQSPRDLNTLTGNNPGTFTTAPASTAMNLCNIHFHKNAEHKGGEFTKYAGNGDGHGFQTGYVYSGDLTASEFKPVNEDICPSEHSKLLAGDTIEVHYVHSSAKVEPKPSLGNCLGGLEKQPMLRVETQVFVLVNDKKALDFNELTKHGMKDGYYQALNLPENTGTPIQYAGSTTGPKFNEEASPLEVTWSVRPKIAKVNIETVGKWCEHNVYDEDHAHGVRNLVINPDLISPISQ